MEAFLFSISPVWTPCLTHRCVCIWWYYILQNYNYKLQFQNLSIYHISHVSIRTLAAENLDVCIACHPWDNNRQLTMGKDRRRQIYGWVCCWYWYQKLGGALTWVGHAFLRQWHLCRGRGGGGVFIYAKVFFPVWCHPWMDDETDEWMDGKLHEKRPQHPLLYVIVVGGGWWGWWYPLHKRI